MPSKKRGGLSKREYAAAAKVKATPKLSVKNPAAPKPVGYSDPTLSEEMNPKGATQNPLKGIYAPVSNENVFTKKPGNKVGGSKSESEARRKTAAKALIPAVNTNTVTGSVFNEPVFKPKPTQGTIEQGKPAGILDKVGDFFSLIGRPGATMFADRAMPQAYYDQQQRQGNFNEALGIPTASASELEQGYQNYWTGQEDTNGENPALSPVPFAPFSETGKRNYLQNQVTETNPNSYKPNNDFENRPQGLDNDPSVYADLAPTQEEVTQQQNETYGGGKPADVSSGTTRRPYGSGAFGTGKGVMSDDPYIKELRKAYSSNGGEKWLRKQFDELIKALDPTYAQMQKEGTDALNAQLNNQNIQLASVMNANNTGDSEQRAQMMARQQADTQTALGNLLAKLSQAKAQDVSGYKSKMAESMGQLQERNQSNKQKLMEAIRAYQNDQYDQQYKNASLSTKGGTKSYGSTLDKIMAERGVDATTARAIYAQQNGLRNVPMQQGDTIQELADAMGVDYATAKQMYLAEQGY